MLAVKLKDTYKDLDGQKVTMQGWVRTNRGSKKAGFIELNDGSTFSNVQVVYKPEQTADYEAVSKITLGSAIEVTGTLKATPGAKQDYEIQADSVEVLGASDHEYPLQKKRHSLS